MVIKMRYSEFLFIFSISAGFPTKFSKLINWILTSSIKSLKSLLSINCSIDALILKINAFYDVRKNILTAKRNNMIKNVEDSDLFSQYKELKNHLITQQKSWQMFLAKLA